MRLLCLPYAGGSAAAFRGWSRWLPADVQVCPVELPGRGTRFGEAMPSQLQQLAKATCEGVLPFLDRPFAIFGHSMGGRLGFEVCRELAGRFGKMPLVFFASGTNPPDIRELNPAHHLSDTQLIDRLRTLNQSRAGVFDYPEVFATFLPVLRADLFVTETYVYGGGPRVTCPLVVFGGLSDDETTREHLDGWGRFAVASKVKMFPGDHFFISTSRHLVLAAITDEIREAQAMRSRHDEMRRA